MQDFHQAAENLLATIPAGTLNMPTLGELFRRVEMLTLVDGQRGHPQA
jgi:hypothetical protein